MAKLPKQIVELRRSYEEWEPTKRFVAWARRIDPTPDETPTSEFVEQLDLKPDDAKELVEGIDALELAKFIVGRRKHPSRLRWQYSLPSIAAVAAGDADTFDPIGRSALARGKAADELIDYVFQLRRDMTIRLSLPADFSQADLGRLTTFLQTLPLSSED